MKVVLPGHLFEGDFEGDYIVGGTQGIGVPEIDFVLATGRTESVRDFCKLVFEQLDMNYEDYVEIDPRYFRPAEVDLLLGDASKAKEKLGWEAATDLEELARIMTQHDLDLAQREAHAKSFVPN